MTTKEVFVTSVSSSSTQGGDILEAVSMSYVDNGFGYKPQNTKGALGREFSFGCNNKTTKIT